MGQLNEVKGKSSQETKARKDGDTQYVTVVLGQLTAHYAADRD